jgi:hypothetical protein
VARVQHQVRSGWGEAASGLCGVYDSIGQSKGSADTRRPLAIQAADMVNTQLAVGSGVLVCWIRTGHAGTPAYCIRRASASTCDNSHSKQTSRVLTPPPPSL